jgi:hypothetical protein
MSEKAKVEQTRVYSRAVVTTICLCLIFATMSPAAALPSAQIMPSSQEVQPGESFTVGLFLNRDNHTVNYGSVEYLTFDPTVVETAVGNVTAGDLWR